MRSLNAARWVSLLAAFVMGAVAEWKLGLAVGLDPYTAALLPLIVDVYGFAAFRSRLRGHVAAALSVMFAAQATSHLLELGSAPGHMVALSILVSAVPPGVSLACHRMGERLVAVATEASEGANAAVKPSPAGEMARDIGGDTAREELPRPVATVNTPAAGAGDTVDTGDTSAVDAVDVPDDTVSVSVDMPTDLDPSLARKISLASNAVRLRQEKGLTWSDAAKALGISRQYLATCRRETGIGV